MEIYIEDVLLQNFLVTYLVIFIVFLFLNEQRLLVWHFLASFLGAGFAMLYPIIHLSPAIMLVLKMLVGYIITLVCYRTKSQKKQMFFYVMFMFVTAIYGGITLFVQFSIYGNFAGDKKLPSIISIIIVLITTYFLKQVKDRLYQKKQMSNFVFKVIIKNDGTIVKTLAYLDTGNVLCDPSTNLPISLVNFKLFSCLNKKFQVQDLLKKNLDNLKDGKYINVKTITGEDSVICFKVDSLEIIDNQNRYVIQNPSFALSKVKMSGFDCDMILNPMQIKGV